MSGFIISLICALRGHKYHVIKHMNPGAGKIGCIRCEWRPCECGEDD